MNRTFWLFILALCVAGQSHAQFYVGAGVGYGTTKADKQANFPKEFTGFRNEASSSGALFAGYRRGWLAVEAGAMRLPTYRSSASTQDYPAYKGLPAGTYPQTAAITQEIFSKALYLRGNAYLPYKLFGKVEAYCFFGRVHAYNFNHEYGDYNGTDYVDYKVSFTNLTWMAGVGAQMALGGKWAARLEYTGIPHATVEEHTLDRDVRMVSLQLLRSF